MVVYVSVYVAVENFVNTDCVIWSVLFIGVQAAPAVCNVGLTCHLLHSEPTLLSSQSTAVCLSSQGSNPNDPSYQPSQSTEDSQDEPIDWFVLYKFSFV